MFLLWLLVVSFHLLFISMSSVIEYSSPAQKFQVVLTNLIHILKLKIFDSFRLVEILKKLLKFRWSSRLSYPAIPKLHLKYFKLTFERFFQNILKLIDLRKFYVLIEISS